MTLAIRKSGDTTDIVQKEMYTFLDKGQRSITLRPEGTAGVVRSYIENGMASLPQPVKLYYNITAYRYENVQKGRPSIFFDRLGIKEISLNINSIGCPVCRAEYNKKLMDYLRPNLSKLCATCNTRFERNPLRIIDCKEESCKKITANLCDDCKNHFEGLN